MDNYNNLNFYISKINNLKLNKLIKLYNNLENYINIKNIIEKRIYDYIHELDITLKLYIIIYYDIKFININYYINHIKNEKVLNNLKKYYLMYMCKLIYYNRINENHVIFDISLLKDEKIFKKITDYYINKEIFDTILLKNIYFVSVYLYYNLSNKYKFDYIYYIHKNNISKILDICKNNLLLFIKYDVFKIDILNRYIANDECLYMNAKDFIDYLVNDDKIPLSKLKILILQNNHLLLDLFNYFSINIKSTYLYKSFNYKFIESFVFFEIKL